MANPANIAKFTLINKVQVQSLDSWNGNDGIFKNEL
jgi:hypothetical protein